jgi:ParB family chromosome partitioning protein
MPPKDKSQPTMEGLLRGRLAAREDTAEIPSPDPASTRNKLVEIPLSRLRPNPGQPRALFDEQALAELTASIDQHGLIQPITIKSDEDGLFIVVAGERRWRAFQRLGRETIPAIITDGNADELALIENLQREDLTPLEEAQALARLMERHDYNQEELGRVIGKARNTVNAILSLNTLPEEIKQESPTSDSISKSVLIEIARLKDREAQLTLWQQVKAGSTVRSTRARKEAGEGLDNQTPAMKMLATGRSFVRRLKRTPPGDLIANRDQYQELLKIKTELEELVARIEMKPIT